MSFEFNNIDFFVSRSFLVKNSDILYKLGFGVDGFSFKFIKVRFLVNGSNSKFSLMDFRLIKGLGSQFFFSTFSFYNKQFGLKTDRKGFSYFSTGSSNSYVLDYFLIYGPESALNKCTAVGFLGKRFMYFRVLVSDIFNFLGSNAYEGLYLDYFGFKPMFAFDLAFLDINNFFSIFRVSEFSTLEKILNIRNLFTFFKIF